MVRVSAHDFASLSPCGRRRPLRVTRVGYPKSSIAESCLTKTFFLVIRRVRANTAEELIQARRHARPIQAALASAGSFAVGAAMPLLVTAIVPEASLIYLVSGTSLLFLALLGGLAAHVGSARVTLGAIRVTFWGALAMVITAGVGALFGTVA
jgi:VIT1/CCC1 family predicted Fe2+/Mn2+ transporter